MAERQTAFLIVFIKENPEKILRGNMKGGRKGEFLPLQVINYWSKVPSFGILRSRLHTCL